MSKIQFDVNVAHDVAIDVAIDVLPVWWMEVDPVVLTNKNNSNLPKLNNLRTLKYDAKMQTNRNQKEINFKEACVE